MDLRSWASWTVFDRHRLLSQEGRHLKTRPLEPADKSRVDQALRRAIVKLSTSAADAGVPIMRWRQDGASSADGALPGLLQMLLAVWAEPALEPGELFSSGMYPSQAY